MTVMPMKMTTIGNPDAYLTVDGDTYTASCPHHTLQAIRTHDPTISETNEMMTRYALQRHASYCELPCMIDLWNEWFETRRKRFVAEGNSNAHG